MSLEQILSAFETLLDGALKAGLFHSHKDVKAALTAHQALQEKVVTEKTDTAPALVAK